MNKFDQRKKSILSKEDKSSKGDWDEKIIGLCDKINSLENYYTTSSCSGRVVVLKDQGIKEKDMFKFVNHDLVEFDEFFDKVKDLEGDLKFKQDAFILHVACRTIEDARGLIEKGLKAGIKRSGIISLGENIIVELNSTERIEFPLVKEGKILVSEDFLRFVVERANGNLEKGWNKIENLVKLII